MDTDSLNAEAAELLARMQQTPPREPGDKLRWQDKARIVALRAAGKTQEDVADEMTCHQSTVSRTLAWLDDSRPLARRLLDANAHAIVQDILDHLSTATMTEKITMLGKLDVIRDDTTELQQSTDVFVELGVQLSDEQRAAILPRVMVEQIPGGNADRPAPTTGDAEPA